MPDAAEQLERVLVEIDSLIEAAAAARDRERFLDLLMRERALPAEIRRAKAAPIRERIIQLEAELEALEDERQRVLGEEHEVPPHQHGTVTPAMMRNQRLGAITARSSRISRELKEARESLRPWVRMGV